MVIWDGLRRDEGFVGEARFLETEGCLETHPVHTHSRQAKVMLQHAYHNPRVLEGTG